MAIKLRPVCIFELKKFTNCIHTRQKQTGRQTEISVKIFQLKVQSIIYEARMDCSQDIVRYSLQ